MGDYDKLFTFDNLYNAYLKCRKGVRWKGSTQRFIHNDLIYVSKLYNELKERRYKTYGFHEFNIIERGKPRHIMALPMRERVVQKCLCDYYLNPLLSKSFIYDNGACVKNKGIDFTTKRLRKHLHSFKDNNYYALTIDLHHYFDTINHTILINKLSKIILDKDILELSTHLINDFKGEQGLGLGSQISQISALFYLNDLDHYIKEVLHIKCYVRYMDDFCLLSRNKSELEKVRNIIVSKLNDLDLTINERKTKITKTHFIFMKAKWYVLPNGKIIKKNTNNTFRRMKLKIKKGVKISASWIDYVSKFNNYFKLKRFLVLYKR